MKTIILFAVLIFLIAGSAYSNDKPSLRPPAVRPLTAFMVEELESWETRFMRERDKALAPLPTLSKGNQVLIGERHG